MAARNGRARKTGIPLPDEPPPLAGATLVPDETCAGSGWARRAPAGRLLGGARCPGARGLRSTLRRGGFVVGEDGVPTPCTPSGARRPITGTARPQGPGGAAAPDRGGTGGYREAGGDSTAARRCRRPRPRATALRWPRRASPARSGQRTRAATACPESLPATRRRQREPVRERRPRGLQASQSPVGRPSSDGDVRLCHRAVVSGYRIRSTHWRWTADTAMRFRPDTETNSPDSSISMSSSSEVNPWANHRAVSRTDPDPRGSSTATSTFPDRPGRSKKKG